MDGGALFDRAASELREALIRYLAAVRASGADPTRAWLIWGIALKLYHAQSQQAPADLITKSAAFEAREPARAAELRRRMDEAVTLARLGENP